MTDHLRHLPRLSIGAAQRLYSLTARALRYYEAHGLVEGRRDHRNNRYYDAAARDRLDWIVRLRTAEVPVAEIREVLEAEGPAERLALATSKLEQARAKAAARLAGVDRAIAQLAGPRGGARDETLCRRAPWPGRPR